MSALAQLYAARDCIRAARDDLRETHVLKATLCQGLDDNLSRMIAELSVPRPMHAHSDSMEIAAYTRAKIAADARGKP